jgi:hypothetical protein
MSAFKPAAECIAPLAPKLGPLLGNLASDHEGEILASVRAIRRLLERNGLSLNDLGRALEAQPVVQVVYQEREPNAKHATDDWFEMARHCLANAEWLSEKEHDFVRTMVRILRRQGTQPTPKQAAWLKDIFDQLAAEGV